MFFPIVWYMAKNGKGSTWGVGDNSESDNLFLPKLNLEL